MGIGKLACGECIARSMEVLLERIELSVRGHWEIRASALLQYKETVDLNSKSHHQK